MVSSKENAKTSAKMLLTTLFLSIGIILLLMPISSRGSELLSASSVEDSEKFRGRINMESNFQKECLVSTGSSPHEHTYVEDPDSTEILSMFEDEFLSNDPNEEVRLIIQFEKPAIGSYIRSNFGSDENNLASYSSEIKNYRNKLSYDRENFLKDLNFQGVDHEVTYHFEYLINGIALTTQMRNWVTIEEHNQVKAIHPVFDLRILLDESVPLIGAPEVWEMEDQKGGKVTGSGISIAVIDTGVDYTHPDLGGCFGPSCKIIGGYDFVNWDDDPMDDNGHGTHVAGIASAKGALKGVAPDSNIFAYKACNSTGSCSSYDVIAALEAASNPDGDPSTPDAVDVINLSIGGLGSPDDILSIASNAAVDEGIVVVAGAGNYGPNFRSLTAPGVAEKVITVAASNVDDTLAYFSSRGPVEGAFFTIFKPDITAPGVAISSTVPVEGELGSPTRYLEASGTSMATPHVAGAAALIKQLHPSWSPALIKSNLMNAAKNLGISHYEQGAGRVQLAKSAKTPLLAYPGSISFGLPLIDNVSSGELALLNLSSSSITTTVTITVHRWADGFLEVLENPELVNYVTVGQDDFSITPGESKSLAINLAIPSSASEGYYLGEIVLRGTNHILRVPIAFTILNKITIHMLDENGAEFIDNTRNNFVTIFKDAHPRRWYSNNIGFERAVPATFFLPSGKYHVHGFGRFYVYGSLRDEPTVGQQQIPLFLFETVNIPKNKYVNVYLDGSAANRFTLDTTTFQGDPLLAFHWGIYLRYGEGVESFLTGVNCCDSEYYDTKMLKNLPESLDFIISNTPEEASLGFYSEGQGYTPHFRSFAILNAEKWYECLVICKRGDYRQMPLAHNADEIHLFEWFFPEVTDLTDTDLSYSKSEVSHFHLNYDYPGNVDDPDLGGGYYNLSGSDAVEFIHMGYGALINPISVGLERDVYVKGAFIYEYFPDKLESRPRRIIQETFEIDWDKSYQFGSMNYPYNADLIPIVQTFKNVNLSTGPMYPSLTFTNTESLIRIVSPLFGSSQGNRVAWYIKPEITVYNDGLEIYTTLLQASPKYISTIQDMEIISPGNYRVVFDATNELAISHANTIEAGFIIPSSDMNPPRINSFEMPQKFSSENPVFISIDVIDTQSGVESVDLLFSTNEGSNWMPAELEKSGSQYQTSLIPGNVDSLSIQVIASDVEGNYLEFSTLGAALREIPVEFNIDVSQNEIPMLDRPYTIKFSGSLRDKNGRPLSKAALLIKFFLNNQFAGYLRDVKYIGEGMFESGTIDFDWTFVPSDFVSELGPTQLRFVFDIGTFSRIDETLEVNIVEPPYKYYLPVIAH